MFCGFTEKDKTHRGDEMTQTFRATDFCTHAYMKQFEYLYYTISK